MRNLHFSSFYFFYFTTVGVIVPYWALYLKQLGFSATQIGELMAIILLTKMITPNLWALIADRIEEKHGSALGILKVATGITLLAYSLFYFVDQFWSVALVMLFFCVFWNACLPQLEAATLNHLGDDRDKYGKIRLWGSMGFVVTVMLVGALVDSFGPSVIFSAGVVSLVSVFVASFWISKKSVLQSQISSEERSLLFQKKAIKELLNSRVVILLTLCFFMQVSYAPFYTFYSLYMESYGYSKLFIGVLWAVGVIFEIVVFLIGYRFLRRFNLISLLKFTFLIAAIRWYLLAEFPEYPIIMFVIQSLHAISYGLYHMVMIQLIDQLFTGRYQVRGQALYSSVSFGAGGAIGSVLSGYIWSYYGHNQLFFAAGVLMFAVLLASMLLLRKTNPQ